MILRRGAAILLVLGAGLLGAACREGEIPPDSGNGGTDQDAMTLVQFDPSPPAQVVAGTPATFRATVTRDGQPLASILVNFSLNPSSGVGTITTSATTSTLGQADAILNTFALPSTTSITITASTTSTTPPLSQSLSISLGQP
jgi:hypothetical protein